MSPPIPLRDERPGAAPARRGGRSLGHDVVLEVPVGLARLEERLGQGETRVVDDEVDPPKAQESGIDRGPHTVRVGDVGGDTDRDVRAAELGGGGLRLVPSRSATTTQAPSAARRVAIALPMPRPRP